ncbi:carboxylating nicotinate-nucleotide diphosphorylase [Bacterioplanoides sp. SCSIO 12839]|uniref:carboxylating nicotinate-nucleotide diphosphorylase n=1 Tax=Bacterioplanoides sp. SCSIO 12839 TaxID=2829569 RepID=UPI0021082184|nr:carboxylating nicotinate-nucleotide diphosphorylase [Bacterioplanoides sp. SCSIO 12839]UTW47746.1 carboxylating nicotinate-nucleotide diphosphorylase [Bacterioplanoides sp. SCSIO 12839]
MDLSLHQSDITSAVTAALKEDVGSGDITAQLIPAENRAHARIISRERAIMAGSAWVNEVFKQLDPGVEVIWRVSDGQWVRPNQTLFELKGSARSLLTGERCALNFLQSLSGTATLCRTYADMVAGTEVKLLDTRKTIPGLRIAQKYAVSVGGCYNHRIGLYDAFLIKENHIMACGGIQQAVQQAQQIAPGKPIEVEVETTEQLDQAIDAGANIIMLDNFTPAEMAAAVAHTRQKTQGGVKLEASGGITDETLRAYAKTGVDFISIGALTKDCKAIDLSMRLV